MKARELSGFISLAVSIMVAYNFLNPVTIPDVCQEPDCLTPPMTWTSEEPLESVDVAAPVVDLRIWPEDFNLPNGQRAQLYAALLLSDGTVECDEAGKSVDPTVLFNMTDVPFACDSAAALLDFSLADQDTVTRSIRFRWPRQVVADEYNIVVTDAVTFAGVLDTLLTDTVLVWAGGTFGTAYRVKGAARFAGQQAAFGDSVAFGYPGDVVLAPVAPIVVDTIP